MFTVRESEICALILGADRAVFAVASLASLARRPASGSRLRQDGFT